MTEWIMALCYWFCAAIFLGISLYAAKTKNPMHFWSGSTVEKREIANISAYNRANALMWLIYGLLWLLGGMAAFFSIVLSAVSMFMVAVPGIPVLIWNYKRIYNQYKR